MKTLVIAGGTGFLGKLLREEAEQRGYRVVVVSRSASPRDPQTVSWEDLDSAVANAFAVINLAGASVGEHRWTQKVRREILESRITSTRLIAAAIERCQKPPVLVNMSAIGYYGNTSVPSSEAMAAGCTFLANVVVEWEREALRIAKVTAVALMRTGVVLDAKQGALPKLLLPMKLLVGGVLGSGKQWMPWIHRTDAVNALLWAAENGVSGPFNVVAPNPVTQRTFIRTLASVLRRPAIMWVPGFVLRLLLGSRADVVLHGQHALPNRLQVGGFVFQYPHLRAALAQLLGGVS